MWLQRWFFLSCPMTRMQQTKVNCSSLFTLEDVTPAPGKKSLSCASSQLWEDCIWRRKAFWLEPALGFNDFSLQPQKHGEKGVTIIFGHKFTKEKNYEIQNLSISVCLYICTSVHLYICISVYLYICIFVYLSHQFQIWCDISDLIYDCIISTQKVSIEDWYFNDASAGVKRQRQLVFNRQWVEKIGWFKLILEYNSIQPTLLYN